MKNYAFNFEIKDLITQFLAAFDDTIVKRYDKNREVKEELSVRYVLGPKQRVIYDIVNKAQNLTLPVVSVNVDSISRDTKRVFNKLDKFYNYNTETSCTEVQSPVPINIEISMSILARYMQDIDQIIGNFVAYNTPYIIISWSEPTLSTNSLNEIRTEVLWKESVSLEYPSDLSSDNKFRLIANTSFTIKGWLFKTKNTDSPLIYKIDANYREFQNKIIDTEGSIYDTVSVDCFPTITNLYYNTSGGLLPLDRSITINSIYSNSITLYGTNFTHTTNVLLSSNFAVLSTGFTTISSKFTGTASGYKIDQDNYSVLNDNIITVNIPKLIDKYPFDIVIDNGVSWATTYNTVEFNFNDADPNKNICVCD